MIVLETKVKDNWN